MLCVFDVNETLLDLAGLDGFFAEVTGDARARREWFDLTIHNVLALTAAGAYRPLGEIGAACLPAVAARHGRATTAGQARELGERMRRLPAHPDAAAALARLRDAGFGVVTLTNSLAEDQLRNAGLDGLVDAAYSADTVRRLKPAPEAYRLVLDSQGAEPAGTVLIAVHGWDVAGAAAAGLRTAFIARNGKAPLPAAPVPTYIATSLDAAARLLTS